MPPHRFGTCSAVLLALVALVALGPDGGTSTAAQPTAAALSVLQPEARAGIAPVPRYRPSRKKGVSLWPSRGVNTSLRRSGARWFWNWDTSHPGVRPPARAEFVPMVWGSGSVTDERLAAATSNGNTLLAFNEPDHADQSNMTVEQALDLWPRLEATGLRLSSPAVAEHGAVPGEWLDRFMTGARQRGYRVDFIAVHWYGSDFDPLRATGQLRDYLRAVRDRYRLPVWLTEYSLIAFGPEGPTYPRAAVQARFVTQSTRMLESLRFVERYAWFSLPAVDPWPRTGLYDQRSRPTAAGRAYARVGRKAAR